MKNHLFPLAASLAIFLTTSGLRAAAPTLEGSRVREQLNEMQGQPAPKLALKGWINAEPMTLKKLKGKIVVLDFWATWCGPCLASIPHTNELMEKYADKGVVIIGVCAKRGAEKLFVFRSFFDIFYSEILILAIFFAQKAKIPRKMSSKVRKSVLR